MEWLDWVLRMLGALVALGVVLILLDCIWDWCAGFAWVVSWLVWIFRAKGDTKTPLKRVVKVFWHRWREFARDRDSRYRFELGGSAWWGLGLWSVDGKYSRRAKQIAGNAKDIQE